MTYNDRFSIEFSAECCKHFRTKIKTVFSFFLLAANLVLVLPTTHIEQDIDHFSFPPRRVRQSLLHLPIQPHPLLVLGESWVIGKEE
jgi:hypothetical protein